MEMFKREAGVDVLHIPYKGTTAALTGLIGGDVDLMVESLPAAKPHIDSGRVKVIATGSARELTGYPEVETVAKYYPRVQRHDVGCAHDAEGDGARRSGQTAREHAGCHQNR
ncbi:tripartite tricarboxylate transporter receptor family protein [Bordetella holmesii 35009]|nr:tripartite tricarboxylate transporter receptor family protein [Bordetella holmesii 35009]